MNEIKKLAEEIRESGEWMPEKCKALCEAAGLADEWEAADGETFEAVLYKAAEILGVDII